MLTLDMGNVKFGGIYIYDWRNTIYYSSILTLRKDSDKYKIYDSYTNIYKIELTLLNSDIIILSYFNSSHRDADYTEICDLKSKTEKGNKHEIK